MIFKIIFMILWLGNGLVRMPHNLRYKKTKKVKSNNTKREKFLVFIAGIGMMLMPMICIFTPWLDSFNMDLPDPVRWIGLTGFGFGLVLFWRVHKTLGRNWSPILEIRRNHKLITDGPYKYIRHPMYTQIWIWVICQWLVLSNWIVGIVGVLAWTILYIIRIPEEEKMMIEEFGQQYEDYITRSKRIIPGVY
ncbi:MAG: isoprenylcysteine carboxylmethyltransferase family protein [Candidatus Aegiribacteria sp.]|nr:isoprenylcysteine carboxylmethyltransferase family protein [Candidatus Aegiribacteria sp.]